MEGLNVGKVLIEGKTKQVFPLVDEPGKCLIVSKDRITCGDGAKGHDMEGKAEISTSTMEKVFSYLSKSGIKTHFVRPHTSKTFIARQCYMIPIEFVTRRIATGSFIRRNTGVPEGYRFSPPKVEYFFKDDANHDPQWVYEQIVSARFGSGDRVIGHDELDMLTRTTRTVFEVLERAWASLDCQLIDMKIEFGIDTETGELLVGDTIDSDSWRLWPSGDKRLMVDKQVYRDMAEVTQEGLDSVKRNFQWVAGQLEKFVPESRGRVVVLMGSQSDKEFCQKIAKSCADFGLKCELRITSAHKGTEETLSIVAQYEGSKDPVVLIAVAGRSNGLGPVLAGNTCLPVINCPPLSGSFATEDVWSSLRLPRGLGCTTVIDPEAAAQAAAHILAQSDHVVWARLRARQLNTWVGLKIADHATRTE